MPVEHLVAAADRERSRVAPRPGRPAGALGIEAAARSVGVSPSALRLWERQGLIAPARTSGGARRYRPEDIARLREVRRWRAVEGLNAAAIRRLLPPPRSGGDTPPGDGAEGGRAASVAEIAARLRALRSRRRLTLRDAAARSGLSVSFISGLERGLTGASIAALRRLTDAYGSTLAELLDEPTVGRLVRTADRRVLDTGSGVRIEHLASAPVSLEPQLFVLEAGATSDGAYSHPGEEFMYVLDGQIAVWLGESEVYRLAIGDSLTFPSTVSHRFQALGETQTRLLWVNTPPTF
ncbi:MAG TPA: MerR family transcriptional regulator [Candidatus Dormibacteraeota bacterium]|nr:MerR family transcriptional regulator [Candidatus Dormibacteraeota bacterium]